MKISELQTELEHFKNNYGDLEVQSWRFCHTKNEVVVLDICNVSPKVCDDTIKLHMSMREKNADK